MPRGSGLSYDHMYVKECIRDILVNTLESGDEFNSTTIALLLYPYKGLSKNDKQKSYLTPLPSLYKSAVYFTKIINDINREESISTRHTVGIKKTVKLYCGLEITQGLRYYRKI